MRRRCRGRLRRRHELPTKSRRGPLFFRCLMVRVAEALSPGQRLSPSWVRAVFAGAVGRTVREPTGAGAPRGVRTPGPLFKRKRPAVVVRFATHPPIPAIPSRHASRRPGTSRGSRVVRPPCRPSGGPGPLGYRALAGSQWAVARAWYAGAQVGGRRQEHEPPLHMEPKAPGKAWWRLPKVGCRFSKTTVRVATCTACASVWQ